MTPRRLSLLLTGGTLAGPLFPVGSFAQGASRDGFSFADHPPSALSNGDFGWIQIGVFVVVGAMIAAAGVAVSCHSGCRSTVAFAWSSSAVNLTRSQVGVLQ